MMGVNTFCWRHQRFGTGYTARAGYPGYVRHRTDCICSSTYPVHIDVQKETHFALRQTTITRQCAFNGAGRSVIQTG